jgi:hypothetical protein
MVENDFEAGSMNCYCGEFSQPADNPHPNILLGFSAEPVATGEPNQARYND